MASTSAAQGAPMETETTQRRGVKRPVDADDETSTAPDPKRPNLQLDPSKKINLHKALAIIFLKLNLELGHIEMKTRKDPEGKMVQDFYFSAEYHNVQRANVTMSYIFTLHRGMRHKSLLIESAMRKQLDSTAKWVYFGKEENMTNVTAAKIMVDTLAIFKFTYAKPPENDRNHWWGTIGPILSIAMLNKVRRDELRVGHSEMSVGIDNQGRMKTVNIAQWGLGPEHHILLEGITMPPSKRSAIAQSVGPMTALITLAKQRSQEKFEGKWANAMKRSMAHIPDIDDLIKGIEGKKASEVREVFRSVADLLLITESREANRASFP